MRGAPLHAGAEHHVADLLRRITRGRVQARLAVLVGQHRGHDRLGVGERRVDFGEHHAVRRLDLLVDAVELRVALRMAIDEAPFAADAQIDLAHRHRIAVAKVAPPALDVLGLAHRLEHECARRIEEPREMNLGIGRGRDFEGLAICYAACRHVSSPFLCVSFAVDRSRGCRSAVPRCADIVRSTRRRP